MKLRIDTKRRLTLAEANPVQQSRLKFVRRFYDAVLENAVRPYVEGIKDKSALDRFQSPELITQPTSRSGGGTVYFVQTSMRNYMLRVEFTDTKEECELKVNLQILNPYTEKQTELVGAEAKEKVDPQIFNDQAGRNKFARRCGGALVRSIKEQIREDMVALQATLSNLKSQVQTFESLLNAFKEEQQEQKTKPATKERVK